MYHTGLANRLREAARRLGTFGPRELADEMGVRSYSEAARVRDALRDFRRRGEVIHLARGIWTYCGKEHAGRGKGVRERIYRAMYTKKIFSVRDLTLLTDADESYIRVLIRRLEEAGRVRRVGRRPLNGTRRKETVFGLPDPDGFYLEVVKGS
ncbi:MAG: hypothetical protein DRH56_06055 [Deltaproteobacteria bacterium]|nr:MAG: hypothetical protein DRH56_06055 [Deltaproteobacteria bacterium]